MSYFNIVAQTTENTVVTEYEPARRRSDFYQSEAALEARFISMLVEQGYERVNITREPDLISNLRKQIEKLNDYTFSDSEWDILRADIERAIDLCDQFRQHEGDVLERDFHRHVDLIEQLLGQVPGYEPERIEVAKERIRRYMADAGVKEVDANRFEQELIYYLEKLDITEEKVRLQKHIDYFRQTMATEPVCGKKLGFVAQEMGREINTTGSKANHVDIQRLVVGMKDELEKIKEQLGNVL